MPTEKSQEKSDTESNDYDEGLSPHHIICVESGF